MRLLLPCMRLTAAAVEAGTAAAPAAAADWWYISGGLDDGLGVRGSPTSDSGGLSTGSAGDDLMIGTTCFIIPPLLLLLPLPALILLGGTSSCDEDDEDDKKVRLWSLWLMPESGEVVQLVDEGGASSLDRRVLSSSVDANATNRSNPELTRSCQLVSSSPTSSLIDLQFYGETSLIDPRAHAIEFRA